MIISFLNQKGGVGKTTLSLNVAHALTLTNNKKPFSVLVIDSDPQQSSVKWAEKRKAEISFSVISLPITTLHLQVPDLAKNYNFTIIDGVHNLGDITISCMMASDLVILPCTPSPYDIWACEDTVKWLSTVEITKPKIKKALVLNACIPKTVIKKETEKRLKNFPIPVLKTHIGKRIIFAELASTGLTVFDVESDSKAKSEIVSLTKEILELWD
jgi:chromosome partitioning protein